MPPQKRETPSGVNSWRLKRGQQVNALMRDSKGRVLNHLQVWEVADIDQKWLTLRADNGDTIKLRRHKE